MHDLLYIRGENLALDKNATLVVIENTLEEALCTVGDVAKLSMPEIVKVYYSNNGTKEALVEFIGKPLEDILMTKPDQRLLVRNEADREKVEWLYDLGAEVEII